MILQESKKDITGMDKFKNVYAACRIKFPIDEIGNDFLSNLIQNTVSVLKVENLLD